MTKEEAKKKIQSIVRKVEKNDTPYLCREFATNRYKES